MFTKTFCAMQITKSVGLSIELGVLLICLKKEETR